MRMRINKSRYNCLITCIDNSCFGRGVDMLCYACNLISFNEDIYLLSTIEGIFYQYHIYCVFIAQDRARRTQPQPQRPYGIYPRSYFH